MAEGLWRSAPTTFATCGFRQQPSNGDRQVFFEVGVEVEQASVLALRQSPNVLRLDVAATCDACEHSCKGIFLRDVALNTVCCASKKMRRRCWGHSIYSHVQNLRLASGVSNHTSILRVLFSATMTRRHTLTFPNILHSLHG